MIILGIILGMIYYFYKYKDVGGTSEICQSKWQGLSGKKAFSLSRMNPFFFSFVAANYNVTKNEQNLLEMLLFSLWIYRHKFTSSIADDCQKLFIIYKFLNIPSNCSHL